MGRPQLPQLVKAGPAEDASRRKDRRLPCPTSFEAAVKDGRG
jgi:hypothetical protein